nr:hypothetical protein [Gemmatimonadaceae bacterium]
RQYSGLKGGLTVTVSPGGGENSLQIDVPLLVTLDSQRLHDLMINAPGATLVVPQGQQFVHFGSLSLDAAAELDLNDNDLIIDSGSFLTVRSRVIEGFAGTSGITSSPNDGSQILALFDNSLVGKSEWNGEPVPAGAIIGKYTRFGDVNLDGQVTGDDYAVIDSNLNTEPVAGLAWLSGDANLDGLVTGDDYTVIDSNLGLGAGNLFSRSAHLSAREERPTIAARLTPDRRFSR